MNRVRRVSIIVKKLVRAGHKDFIIYPYGTYGKTAERCLSEWGIKPVAILDNQLSKTDSAIKSIDFLRSDAAKDCILLVSTVRKSAYDAVKKMEGNCVPEKQTVVIFKDVKSDKISWNAKMQLRVKHPRGKDAFLMFEVKNNVSTRLLDVGCGNDSAYHIKSICNKIHYIGLDVGDYNQSQESKGSMDEYIVVPPTEFAKSIEELDNIDSVISSHNLEHCNEPERVLRAICKCLKKNGKLYLAFPSEKSVTLPKRGGTLNFYDDSTHIYLPEYDKILQVLSENGMKIVFKTKTYSPFFLRRVGKKNERASIQLNRILDGTWAYWGFESIIWAKKV